MENLTTNSTTERHNSTYSPPRSSHAAQVTSLAILGVIIVLGNLVSIITFVKTQSLRRRCHYLIISLSVADLLFGFVALMAINHFLPRRQGSASSAHAYIIALEFFDTWFGTVSILTLVTISLERLHAIVYPFRHRRLRYMNYMLLVLLPWVLSSVVSVTATIKFVKVETRFFDKVYKYLNVGIPTLALSILLISYISIGLKIRQKNRAVANHKQASRDQKLAVTLFIVTLASLTTWLPVQCLGALIYFYPACLPENPMSLLFAIKFLQYCNSGINVFIYVVRMPKFRLAFLVLFCGKVVPRSETSRTMYSMYNPSFVGDKIHSTKNKQSLKTCQEENPTTQMFPGRRRVAVQNHWAQMYQLDASYSQDIIDETLEVNIRESRKESSQDMSENDLQSLKDCEKTTHDGNESSVGTCGVGHGSLFGPFGMQQTVSVDVICNHVVFSESDKHLANEGYDEDTTGESLTTDSRL